MRAGVKVQHRDTRVALFDSASAARRHGKRLAKREELRVSPHGDEHFLTRTVAASGGRTELVFFLCRDNRWRPYAGCIWPKEGA